MQINNILTFLLLPTWYTNFLSIYTNYNKLTSSTYFERILPIIRRPTTQIVHMQLLVSSLSAGDCLVQPLRKSFLSGCTRRSPAESDDTRGCICTICVVGLLMMVSSLSEGDCLVQPLKKDFLSGFTRQSPAESDDTRSCICTICVVGLLMMGGMCSKHVEEVNLL